MILSRYIPALRRAGSCALHWMGLAALHRRTRLENKGTVVFYHDVVHGSPVPGSPLFVEADRFWSHIGFLSERYSLVDLSVLSSGLPWPARPLAVTFDGYSRNFLEVARRLAARKIPAVFYLITEPILAGRPHWHQQLAFILGNSKLPDPRIRLDGEEIALPPPRPARSAPPVFSLLAARIERSPEKYVAVRRMAEQCGVALEPFLLVNRPLTPNEVGEMAGLPGIAIGSHSHTHPRDMDPASALRELKTSKEYLEAWTGKPVLHYAYPEGRRIRAAADLLPGLGYRTAAVTGSRLLDPRSPADLPFGIPRFMLSNTPVSVVAGRLTGWERILDRMIEFRRGRGRKP